MEWDPSEPEELPGQVQSNPYRLSVCGIRCLEVGNPKTLPTEPAVDLITQLAAP